MTRCKSCDAEIQSTARFCASCGTAAVNPEEMETIAMGAASPSNGRPATAVAGEKQRFAPGTLIASRYRVISRLGKGGMGEVFRADDIILGQSVALKFLPEAARSNANLLTRFYDEVRIARQIAHKNVCRVYDIGELGGQPYLSMEYIDGEDLAGLLRRIGRLPGDKAIELARKLCAGLSAAHEKGVLHRDLKPANIMIDGRGELRIMDFGLAGIAEQLQGNEIRNGTPAYMAPEQLAGREVSVQSDIYALGLVLYEMFTGKPPFQADTVAEMVRLREESQVTNPSTLVAELDKTTERAILRCLEADPRNRPASALALAAMLPGGDPLAEALAAGETPSPEMVANAGSDEGLHWKVAVPVAAGIVGMLIAFCLLYPKTQIMNRLALENPPEVLAAKARDLIRTLGYPERPADTAFGFLADGAHTQFLQQALKVHTDADWTRVLGQTPSPMFFWYRQSPAALVARDLNNDGRVTTDDPPMTVSGMVYVALDIDGRLKWLRAVPPQFEPSAQADNKSGSSAPLDWTPFFAAVHLDPAQFQTAEPQWAPLAATEDRFAWTGMYPGRPELNIRVEAASFHGKPVLFEIFWPWTRPRRAPPSGGFTSAQVANLAEDAVVVLFAIGACFVARYNWKAGRGDMRGGMRVGAYIATLSTLSWVLWTHHISAPAERDFMTEAVSAAIFSGVVYWVVYLALEPWVRRYWPQTLISWSRLLAGRWRDPMIGRDALFAVLLGLMYCLLNLGLKTTVQRLGAAPMYNVALSNLMGGRSIVWLLLQHLQSAIVNSLQAFLMLFVLRALLRRQWLAAAALVFIQASIAAYRESPWYIIGPYSAAIVTILVVIMLRFGLLATVLTIFVANFLLQTFLTTDFTAWYSQSSIVAVVVVVALTAWGLKLSLSGRPAVALKT
jgi:serine/threonine-protein kinase